MSSQPEHDHCGSGDQAHCGAVGNNRKIIAIHGTFASQFSYSLDSYKNTFIPLPKLQQRLCECQRIVLCTIMID